MAGYPPYAPVHSRTWRRSQSARAATPSPVLAERKSISMAGLRARALRTSRSRSKSKQGSTSVLPTASRSQAWYMSGYLSGLSSPSGTERRVMCRTAPVSNSAGQTRLPTFSRTMRSKCSLPKPRSPCRVMSASRWHIPPVWSCTAGTPSREIASASTDESMSASMTPQRTLPARCGASALRSVVLPEPGDDIMPRHLSWHNFSTTSTPPMGSPRLPFVVHSRRRIAAPCRTRGTSTCPTAEMRLVACGLLSGVVGEKARWRNAASGHKMFIAAGTDFSGGKVLNPRKTSSPNHTGMMPMPI